MADRISVDQLRADLKEAVSDIFTAHLEICLGGCDCIEREARTQNGIDALLALAESAHHEITYNRNPGGNTLELHDALDRFDFGQGG